MNAKTEKPAKGDEKNTKPADGEKPTDEDKNNEGGDEGAGGDEGGSEGDEGKKKSSSISREEFEEFKRKSNKENEKHRREKREAEERYSALQKQLASALGVKSDEGGGSKGTVADVTKNAETRHKNLLLRAEFTAIAAKEGVVDPSDAFELARRHLGDVEVDLENETVDTEALRGKIAELKTSKPYLFGSASSGSSEEGKGGAKPPPAKMPDKGGAPASGGTMYQQWKSLVNAGRTQEANAFYAKNKPAIQSSWPKS